MSKICVCIEEDKTDTIMVPDNDGVQRSVEVKVTEYHPQKEEVFIQTDYMGNIYLKHGEDY